MLWLVGQLPPDSAYIASMRGGPEFRAWTPVMHMLAAIANLLFAANRQRAGKKTRDPLIAPPTQKKQPRRVSVAESAARQRALEANTES